MRRTAIVSVVASGALAAVVLAACGSGNAAHRSDSTSGASSDVGAAIPGAQPSAALGPTYGLNEVANGAAIKTVSTGDAGAANVTGGLPIADTRALIRTANMTVVVKTAAAVATQANAAEAQVTKIGGEVFGDSRNNGTADEATSDHSTATLTLKVPPAQLTAILTSLSQLGKEQSRSLSSQDVTTQVADVNARLASDNASIVRLRSLYSSASKVTDVIAIESELSTRESELESLQAQQRALSAETVMATVTLVLTTVAAPVSKPHHHHYSGIGGAIANGWHRFGTAGSWLVTALATVVPFLVLAALLLGAGLWARRRRPTASPTPVPATE